MVLLLHYIMIVIVSVVASLTLGFIVKHYRFLLIKRIVATCSVIRYYIIQRWFIPSITTLLLLVIGAFTRLGCLYCCPHANDDCKHYRWRRIVTSTTTNIATSVMLLTLSLPPLLLRIR